MDLVIAARVGAQRWFERMPRTLPLAAFVLAMTATLLFVAYNEHREAERRQAQTNAVASVVASALARRANTHTAYMRAVAILLTRNGHINQREFNAIASELNDDEEYRGSEGISWSPLIRREDIPAFEAARRAEGITDFTVRPAPMPGQRLIAPVTYIGRPASRLRLAYGFDIYSEPNRRVALAQALRDRRPTASGRVLLVMDKGRPITPSFVIYMPVFTGQGQVLRGFVGAAFNADVFLDSALAMEPVRDLAVTLYDGKPDQQHLLAHSGPAGQASGSASLVLYLAHHPVLLVVSHPPANALNHASIVALALGTTVALLLTAVAWMVAIQAAEDRASLAWLREQASIRGTLSRELNHRVKNTLASVLSIIALTRRRASSLKDFADTLDGRIRALSATHDLLIASNWGPTPLRAIIAAELAPYTRGFGDGVVALTGPNVDLAPNDALSLGLALHELATNASKYGALSAEGGRVTVNWAMEGTDKVRVQWTESGGPKVTRRRPRGFGTELIERIVAHELGEPVLLDFAEDGVHCELVLPVRSPAAFHFRAHGKRTNP